MRASSVLSGQVEAGLRPFVQMGGWGAEVDGGASSRASSSSAGPRGSWLPVARQQQA